MTFERIEAHARSVEIDEALQSQVADPLWMLGRQWQVGEFHGDDAAQPAAVRMRAGSTRLVSFKGARMERPAAVPQDVPLEAVIESSPVERVGMAGMRASAEAGRRLMRRFREAGLHDVADRLAEAFPLSMPDHLLGENARAGAAARMLARGGVDGHALGSARADRLGRILRDVPAARRDAAGEIHRAWRSELPADRAEAWEPQRLEYSFSVAAWTDTGEKTLVADEHHGGHLDWYSFDVSGNEDDLHGISRQPLQPHEVTAIPTPVRYHGMPAGRWWEFEDGEVHFGDIDAGPSELYSMALAEFATVYSDDWFYVPLRLQRGTLSRVLQIDVIDTMGGVTTIEPTTQLDHQRAPDGPRPFRLFELAGDPHIAEERAPYLLLPPVVATSMSGAAIERVVFARDEGANLAWGVERLIEGPLGRAIDRGEAFRSRPRSGADETSADTEPRRYGEEVWRYRLESAAPPWWIPFIPQRVEPDSPQTILRRARLHSWDDIDDRAHVGPRGTLLQPTSPMTLFEEEVPRSGAIVERSWQFARTVEGGYVRWLQRSKRNGRDERSSGLRWDVLEEGALD